VLGWKITRIQEGKRGLVPVEIGCMKNEDGSVYATVEAQGERWRIEALHSAGTQHPQLV